MKHLRPHYQAKCDGAKEGQRLVDVGVDTPAEGLP